ncbi:SDR family NAD(P)-dependent oxidoreductase [Nakamurella leprariae]|uniref:Glucose 1-dehydrogenase n=1 Tax=Nakamurella leprariae TaxID=2803911 RepID=A0A939C031_9ACTN|nr:glucose 1-dehydrogenase [Nakamurella leprariae]MBM9468341.1 glucose 1-dehydrogenase [Nakamurella leprariae]
MGRVEGKVAIVTGGGSGIGAATVRKLAAEGAKVVIGDLQYDNAVKVAESIGDNVSAVYFDAVQGDTIENLINTTMERHGRIDILHNNAALVGPTAWFEDGTVLSTSVELWDRSFATNVRSIFLASKFALPHMVAGGGGSIINMASIGGLIGGAALTAYGTTKAAVIGLTRNIAAQHGKEGVRCNAIAPGVIQTEQLLAAVPDMPAAALAGVATPRVGVPDDIANMVLFLASDESAFITGETYRVDGGSMTTGGGG